MKRRLDENSPVKLKYRFNDAGLTALTVRDMQWLGRKNGELLQLRQAESFTTFITVDNNLSSQQNFVNYPLQVIILIAQDNVYETIMEFFPDILEKLKEPFTGPQTVVHPSYRA